MKMKRLAVNAVMMAFSVVVALLLCEIGARLFLNSADYLSVTTVKDDVLGMTIGPDSPGFDDWGFRNPSVPRQADVVAVGDSHTFGNTARMDEAWPSVVGRSTGLSVYNLGLGGYGPNQYYQLLTTRGLELHPKWVLCGLYFGDDFENAFSITYGLPHWSYLRQGRWDNVDPNIWDVSSSPSWQKRVRNWLSRRSMTYQLVVHGALLATMKQNAEFKQVADGLDTATTALVVENRNIREAFRPVGIASRLDQSSPPVVEGMRITFQLLQEMDAACRKQSCTFAVVIIPTKETVFADYFRTQPTVHLGGPIQKIISNEQIARTKLISFLETTHINYVDALPALRRHAGEQLYARTTQDMHPGKNGYRVIGETVAEFLSKGLAQR
jgi:hypothetical protein